MKIAQSVMDLVGGTPLIRLNKISPEAEIFAKCEFMNPSSSIKDRAALFMMKRAASQGLISSGGVIIEPTSGNTGIALASFCARQNIRLILTMPSSMSEERKQILRAFGAELVLTDPAKGMSGAVAKAEELRSEISGAIILQQFANEANVEAHYETTAVEILSLISPDIFVAGVGTGGTITGVAKRLKEANPAVKIVAVEPASSAVLSGNSPAPHKIQGIGAGFKPAILDMSLVDQVVQVANEDAFSMANRMAKEEGLLVGISSGANVWASSQIANQHKGKKIVTVLPDTGERYLSSGLFAI